MHRGRVQETLEALSELTSLQGDDLSWTSDSGYKNTGSVFIRSTTGAGGRKLWQMVGEDEYILLPSGVKMSL